MKTGRINTAEFELQGFVKDADSNWWNPEPGPGVQVTPEGDIFECLLTTKPSDASEIGLNVVSGSAGYVYENLVGFRFMLSDPEKFEKAAETPEVEPEPEVVVVTEDPVKGNIYIDQQDNVIGINLDALTPLSAEEHSVKVIFKDKINATLQGVIKNDEGGTHRWMNTVDTKVESNEFIFDLPADIFTNMDQVTALAIKAINYEGKFSLVEEFILVRKSVLGSEEKETGRKISIADNYWDTSANIRPSKSVKDKRVFYVNMRGIAYQWLSGWRKSIAPTGYFCDGYKEDRC